MNNSVLSPTQEKEGAMVFYATKETMERYNLKTPREMSPGIREIGESTLRKEAGKPLYAWGVKLFYFDRRKSLQLVHARTKMTVFLIDIKVAEMKDCGDILAYFLLELYRDDPQMQAALKNFFLSAPIAVYDKLTDRSLIATLNHTQTYFAWDGDRFFDFIRDGILHTKEINREVADYPMKMNIDGNTEYIIPKEYFRTVIMEAFGTPRSTPKQTH